MMFSTKYSNLSSISLILACLVQTVFSIGQVPIDHNTEKYLGCFYDPAFALLNSTALPCNNTRCSLQGYAAASNSCICVEHVPLNVKISDRYCFNDVCSPCHFFRVYALCKRYTFQAPRCTGVCFCKSGFCKFDGSCDSAGCWDGSRLDTAGKCHNRDCNLLDGDCANLCAANDEFIYDGCTCASGKQMLPYSNECRNVSVCNCPNCNPTCACHTGFIPIIYPTYQTCIPEEGQCEFFDCPSGYCYEDDHGMAHCGCQRGSIALEGTKCTDVHDCNNYPLCHICKVDFNGYLDCRCQPGYELKNNYECHDIDECADIKRCTDCTNYEGSYYCFCNFSCDISYVCRSANPTQDCRDFFDRNPDPLCRGCKEKSLDYEIVETHRSNSLYIGKSWKFLLLHLDGQKWRNEKNGIVTWNIGGQSFTSRRRLRLDLKDSPFTMGQSSFTVRVSINQRDVKQIQLHLLNDDLKVEIKAPYSQSQNLGRLPMDTETHLLDTNVLFNNVGVSDHINYWYCTTKTNLSYHEIIDPVNNNCFRFTIVNPRKELSFKETDLRYLPHWSYQHFIFYVYVTYNGYQASNRVIFTYTAPPPALRMICKENCQTSKNRNIKHTIKIDCPGCDSASYSWLIPGSPEVRFQSSILERQLNYPPQTLNSVIKIYLKRARRTIPIQYPLIIAASVSYNCTMSPQTGFAFESKFYLNCAPVNYSVKITSGYCHLQAEAGFLRFQGKNLTNISLRAFSAGNVINSHEKCLFMQTMSNFEDLHKIKFVVRPRYMYVPNFIFLNKNKHTGLASLNDIQNSVEYLNEDESLERLDISLKAKHRTQIFFFLFEAWFANREMLIRHEIVKTLESLVSQPYEVDPFLSTRIVLIKAILNIYKSWNSSVSYLDYKEIKFGYKLVAKILAALLHATYLQSNVLAKDYQSKDIIGNITDGLYYYGEAYTDFARTSNLTIEQTLVFTFASQKIFVSDFQKDLHLEIFTHNGHFMVDIPSAVLNANNQTNVYKLQLVVFPYNPLELQNHTLYIPTVSILIKRQDDVHLDLNDFYNPVKITIPSEALGHWLNYRKQRTYTNITLDIELPETYFDNTIYKFNLNLKFSALEQTKHRSYGFFVVAVCNGTKSAKQNQDRGHLCYELMYRHVDFYLETSINLNFTLPPLLTKKQSLLTMKYTSLYNNSIFISLNLKQASCQYWYHSDFQTNNVTSYGCSVSSVDTDEKNLVCFCYHLSTFSGTIEAVDTKLWYRATNVFNQETAHIGVLTILIIWIFYTILSIWAIYKDHIKSIMAFPVDLCDNFPSFQVVYMVIVETGVRPNAGCEGSAFIVLQGTLGKSMSHKLKCRYYPTLQKGEENYFLIRTKDLLGDLTSIRIWITDNKNDQGRISWYIDRITVYDLQSKETYEFLCDEWLALNTKNYFSDLTFMAASQVSLNDFKHLFTVNFYATFEDTHAWFSIFSCPIQSPYTRFQRTISCLLNTHIYLLTTLLLQHYDTSDNKNANLFATGLWEVIMTLICGFCLVPVFSLITFSFSQSRTSPTYHILSDWNRNTTRMLSTPKKNYFKEEVVDDSTSFLNRLKTLFQRLNKKKDEIFVFFHFTDPEVLKTNYLKKHPHMKDILALRDDDDPFDNLRQAEKAKNANFSNINHYSDGTNQFEYFIINEKSKTPNSKELVKKVKVNFEMGDLNEKEIFDKNDVAETYETMILNIERNKDFKMLNEIENFEKKQKNISANNAKFKVSLEEEDNNRNIMNADNDDKNEYEDFEPNTDLDEAIEKNVTEALKTEAKKKLKKKKDYEGVLPPWVRYLAWFMLIMANLICAYFIILLISWNSENITLTWYLKVFATFCGNIFLLDPALIIMYALAGSMVSGSTMVYPYGKLSVIKSEAIIDLKNNYEFHMKRVLRIRQDPHYNHANSHRQRLKLTKKIKRSQRLFLSIIVNVFLALFSYTLCFTSWDNDVYLTYASIEKVLFPLSFSNIIERDDYYNWVRNTLIEELYPPSTTNSDARAMVFSRVNKFSEFKHLNAYAITYPCFTRIRNDYDSNLKTWKAYLYGPEWYIHRTYCLGYDKQIALEMVNEMQETFFLNEKFYGLGMTFYFHLFNTQCIVWCFTTAFHAPGGGLVTRIDKISVINKRTIPYHKNRVIISLVMFFPAFAFFVFTSMRTFLYEGAGYYFGSIWNIIDMLASFLVLILNIIIVVVLPGMEEDLENFYHDTGDLQTLFYISGVDGIYFLMFFIMFLSFIKLIESMKVHQRSRTFITTTLNASKPTILIFVKLFPLFFGSVIMKGILYSKNFLEYSTMIGGTINFLLEMVCRRQLIELSISDPRLCFAIMLQKIFGFLFLSLVAAQVMEKLKHEGVMKFQYMEGKLLTRYVLQLFYSFISKITSFKLNPYAKVRRRL